jgi:hypothetical protein
MLVGTSLVTLLGTTGCGECMLVGTSLVTLLGTTNGRGRGDAIVGISDIRAEGDIDRNALVGADSHADGSIVGTVDG